MELVYTPVAHLVRAAYRMMDWRPTLTGGENVPPEGPAVIAINHTSYLDFTFAGWGVWRATGRLPRFAAKREIFDHPLAGPLMRSMKHVSVDRDGDPSKAYAEALEVLRRGEQLMMYPEGTIQVSFVPGRGKTGTARLAQEAGVPLVPCTVWGAHRLVTKGRSPELAQRDVPVSVHFAAAMRPGPDDGARDVTDALMAQLRADVDRLAQEYPDPPAPGEPDWWVPAHLGGGAPTVEEAEAAAARYRAERLARAQERGRRKG